MDQASFAVLDNAIEQGAVNLSPKALGVSAKAGKTLLAGLCESGLLSETKSKYSLTDAGRQAWEQAASGERKAAVQAKAEAAERNALTEFLRLVEKAEGKALKPADLKKLPSSTPEKATAEQLVEPGEKDRTYRLRPAGRLFLLAALPPAEQVAGLRAGLGELTAQWEGLVERLARDWRKLASNTAAPDANIHSRVAAARSGFEQALAEAQAFSSLLEAGQRLKDSLGGSASELLSRMEEETSRAGAMAEALRESVTAHQAEWESFRRSFEEQIRDLESKLAQTPQPAPAPELPESAVWDSTRQVYDQLRAEAERLGGIVNIAQLSDGVLAAVLGLDAARFRQLLQQWQQEDRLILQVCNDPRLEPRAGEGIESGRGLLFYVKLL